MRVGIRVKGRVIVVHKKLGTNKANTKRKENNKCQSFQEVPQFNQSTQQNVSQQPLKNHLSSNHNKSFVGSEVSRRLAKVVSPLEPGAFANVW